jgi:hypothetical protein
MDLVFGFVLTHGQCEAPSPAYHKQGWGLPENRDLFSGRGANPVGLPLLTVMGPAEDLN